MENGISAYLVHLQKKDKVITSSTDQSHDWWRSIFMGSTGNNYDINKHH